MGNIMTTEPELTQEQLDLKFLGERLPFSDSEIRFLYKAYQTFGTIEERKSFLYDWSYCVGAHGLFEVLQEHVLPTGKPRPQCDEPFRFGNALFYATLHVDGDVRPYCKLGDTQKNSNVDDYTRKARLEKFFDGLATASRRGSAAVITSLFRTIAHLHGSEDDRVHALDFIEAGYRISFAADHLQAGGPKSELKELSVSRESLAALANSMVNKAKSRRQRSGQFDECPHVVNGRVQLEDVLEWSDSVAPMFEKPIPQGRSTFDRPVLNDESSILTEADQFSLACLSPSLTGPWFRLYTSSADGLSFNRLLKAILGYGGPTLFVVRSTSGAVFGAYTSSAWKESKDFYGNTDCFLYQLTPTTSVYLPTGNARNFMYCNPAARSRGYDQQSHGIGFGGTTDQPRLFFSEHLDDPCFGGNRDLTFDNGKLDPNETHFHLDALEVWGVGGAEAVQSALQARGAKRALKDEAIRRARKVDKAQFLDDFRAGTFDSKAFAHQQQVDGRAREEMDERAKNKDKVFEYAK